MDTPVDEDPGSWLPDIGLSVANFKRVEKARYLPFLFE